MLGEREHDGRDEGEAGDMVILDGLQHVHEIEPRHGHDRVAALQLGKEDDREAIDMEEWDDDEEREVILTQEDGIGVDLDGAGDDVEVGEDNAFGEARGARGVEEGGGVGLPDVDGRGDMGGREALGVGQQAMMMMKMMVQGWVLSRVDDEDREAQAGELGEEVGVHEDELGARVAGLPRDLARGVHGVRGRGHGSEPENGEEEDGEVD